MPEGSVIVVEGSKEYNTAVLQTVKRIMMIVCNGTGCESCPAASCTYRSKVVAATDMTMRRELIARMVQEPEPVSENSRSGRRRQQYGKHNSWKRKEKPWD